MILPTFQVSTASALYFGDCSGMLLLIWVYMAHSRTPNIDFDWVGAVTELYIFFFFANCLTYKPEQLPILFPHSPCLLQTKAICTQKTYCDDFGCYIENLETPKPYVPKPYDTLPIPTAGRQHLLEDNSHGRRCLAKPTLGLQQK